LIGAVPQNGGGSARIRARLIDGSDCRTGGDLSGVSRVLLLTIGDVPRDEARRDRARRIHAPPNRAATLSDPSGILHRNRPIGDDGGAGLL